MGVTTFSRLDDPWNTNFPAFSLLDSAPSQAGYKGIYLSKALMNQDFLPANTFLHPENFTGPGSSRFRENYIPTDPNAGFILDNAYRNDVGVYTKEYAEWMDSIPHMSTRFHLIGTNQQVAGVDLTAADRLPLYTDEATGQKVYRYGLGDYYPDEWLESIDGQNFRTAVNYEAGQYGYEGPVFIQGAWGLAPIYYPDGNGRGEYKWTFFKEANSSDWIEMNGDDSKEFKKQPEASTWFPRKYSTENYDKGFLYYAPAAVQFEIAGFRKKPEGCTSSVDFDGADIVVENFERYRAINAKGKTGVSLAFIALDYNEHPSREEGYTGPIHENGFIPDVKAVELGLYDEFHANGVGGNEVNITGNDGNQYGVLVGTQKVKILTSQGTADQYGRYAYQVKDIKEDDDGESHYRHLEDSEDAYEEEWQDVVDDEDPYWTDKLDLYCKGDVESNALVTVDIRSTKPQKYGYTGLQSLVQIPIKIQSLHPGTHQNYNYFKDPDNIHEYGDGDVCSSCDSYTIHLEKAGVKVELNRIAEEASSGWYDFIRASHDSRGVLPPDFEELNRLNAGVLAHVGGGVYESLGGSESQYFQRISFDQATSTTSVYLSLGGTEYNYSFSSGPGPFQHTSRRFFYEDNEEEYNHYITSGELPKDLSEDTPVQIWVSEPEENLNFGDSVIYTGNFYDSSSDSENITIDYTIDPAVVTANTAYNVALAEHLSLIPGEVPCEMLEGWDGTSVQSGNLTPSGTVNGTMADYHNDIAATIPAPAHPISTCAPEQQQTMRVAQLDTFFQNVSNDTPDIGACCFLHVRGSAATDVYSSISGEMKFQWGTAEGHGADPPQNSLPTGPIVFGSNKLLSKTGRGQPDFFSTHTASGESVDLIDRKHDLFVLKVSAEGTKLILKAVEGAWGDEEFDLINDHTTRSHNKPQDTWDIPCEDYSGFRRGDNSSNFYDGHSARLPTAAVEEEELLVECGEEGSRFPGICLRFETETRIYLVSIAFKGEVVSHTLDLDLFGDTVKMMSPRYRGASSNHDWVEPVYLPKNQP